MNARVRILVLVVLSVAQVGAAAWSIARYESTLRFGALYRIGVQAFDPADAFRGRYVAVQPSIVLTRPIAPATEQLLQEVQAGSRTAYVVLATDAQGFARVGRILTEAPPSGDYLEVGRVWPRWSPQADPPQSGQLRIIGYNLGFAFDRYYMNEAAAPAAQQRYVEAMRRNTGTRAWLAVRVRNGVGVIEGLFIDGVPIEEIVAAPVN